MYINLSKYKQKETLSLLFNDISRVHANSLATSGHNLFTVLVLCMMSQNRWRPPLEALGLNAPHSSIVRLQWGLSADTKHME